MWTYNYLETQEGQTWLMGLSALTLLGLSFFILVYLIASKPASPSPDRGTRGLRRAEALKKSSLLNMIDPLLRFVAGRVSTLPLNSFRENTEVKLVEAGDYLGLTPDEYIALSFLSGLLFLSLGALGTYLMFSSVDPMMTLVAASLGFYLPHLQVQGEIAKRYKQLNRGLPFSIDLMALAMSAGLDFRGAIRQVTDKAPDKSDALYEELIRIQQEMDLGHTRRQALQDFAERCPTDSVKDFVAAVVQAEEKGNPLVEVLNVQANMLRMRRSIAAEEAAARAGVLLLGPLMMIFACIMIILMGPFAVGNMLGGKGGL